MKKVILLLVVALSVVTASAQIKVGLNGGVGIPMGNDADVMKTGFGGGISAEYLVTPNIGVGLSYSFNSFGLKDEYLEIMDMVGVDASFSISPTVLTGRYYFQPENSIKPYAGLDLGIYSQKMSMKVLGFSVGSISTSDFGLAPVVGLQFGLSQKLALDVNAKYHYVFTEGDSSSFIGFNLGLVYTFGK